MTKTPKLGIQIHVITDVEYMYKIYNLDDNEYNEFVEKGIKFKAESYSRKETYWERFCPTKENY